MMEKRTLDAKVIYSLLSAHRSYGQAKSAAVFLLEEVDFSKVYSLEELRKFQCYETTLIIAYSRPFTNSYGVNKINIEDNLDISLTDVELELHEKILKLRNKIIAHSDKEHVSMQVYNIKIEDTNVPFSKFHEGLYLTCSEIDLVHDMLFRFISKSIRALAQSKLMDFDELQSIQIDVSAEE